MKGTFWLWVWSLYPLLYPSYLSWQERRDAREDERHRRWEGKYQKDCWEKQRLEAEQEEQTRRNEILRERASADGEFGDVAAQFADLVDVCGSQVVEMTRATKALGGGNFEDKTAKGIFDHDVLRILSVISNAKGEVPTELGRLYQAIYGRLSPKEYFFLEQHSRRIEDIRRKPQAVDLPLTIDLLQLYDGVQGTRLAAKAAAAYWALVLAACEIVDSNPGVAARMVQAKYLELLRPYFSSTNGEGSGGQAGSDGSRETEGRDCQDCAECSKYFEILRVSPNATREEVKTAFRSLAKIYHSDHHHGREDGVRRTADDLFMDLKEAYDHISGHWSP